MAAQKTNRGCWAWEQRTAGGKLLREGAAETVEDIQTTQHLDYLMQIARVCENATENPREWQEIILGPPQLAGTVDRLRIRWEEFNREAV